MMDMNNVVAIGFVVIVAGVIGYNAYKNMVENKARKAEIKSLQEQISTLTGKLKTLIGK